MQNLRDFSKWCKRSFDIFSSYLWTQITHKDMEVIWNRDKCRLFKDMEGVNNQKLANGYVFEYLGM